MSKPAANADIIIDYYKRYFDKVEDVQVIFEIGANDLEDTRRLHRGFPTAEIYAFEPRLASVVKVNEKVKVFPIALSDVSEENKKFYIPVGWEGASSLLKPKKEPGVEWTMKKEIREVLVNVNTANEFCQKNNIQKIDVVWMDVQGNELRVLKGMTDFLADIKIIQTEAGVREYYENHTLFTDIEEFLKPYGFGVVYNILEGGREFKDGITWEFETDVIFVNKNKLEPN